MQPASCQDADNAVPGARAGTEAGAGSCREALASPRSLHPRLPNAAQAVERKKRESRAQMERAAQPLQKQSAPRKQMLLLQQAPSCWLLSGSFSQARDEGKWPRSRMPLWSKPFRPASVPSRESWHSFRPAFPPHSPSVSSLVHLQTLQLTT